MNERCFDCPRRCGADRNRVTGFCGIGGYARVAKLVDPFYFEEPCLGKLSAVFFGGCNLRCSYCQNYLISRGAAGEEYTDERLAAAFDNITEGNALDLVTPTHCLSSLERAFSLTKKCRRVIYNTSGYETAEGVRRAKCFTSVFLADYKYALGDVAKKFSGAADYPETALAAIKLMRETKDEWEDIDCERVLTSGLVVRHLVLPGHVDNSIKALNIIADELGTDTVISLMSQFTPNGVGEPNARLKRIEYKIVAEHALKLGFGSGYFQSFDSADSKYTPDF
ncbi:MAG: 4Fe-4S cluster-binding domain-containing protein [Clostridiales bacterium]|nr:4Fe-4S cluster-binding domain-containing protein [Clostridiales bacterium]